MTMRTETIRAPVVPSSKLLASPEVRAPHDDDDDANSTDKNESDEDEATNQASDAPSNQSDNDDRAAPRRTTAYYTIYYPACAERSMYHGTYQNLPLTTRLPPASYVQVVLAASSGALCVATDLAITFVDCANGVAAPRLCLRGDSHDLCAVLQATDFRAPDAASGVATVEMHISTILRAEPTLNAAASKLWVRTGGARVDMENTASLSPRRRQSLAYNTSVTYVPAVKHTVHEIPSGLWVPKRLVMPTSPVASVSTFDDDVSIQSMLDNCEAELYVAPSSSRTTYYTLHYPSRAEASMWSGAWSHIPFSPLSTHATHQQVVHVSTSEGHLRYAASTSSAIATTGSETRVLALQGHATDLNAALRDVLFVAPSTAGGVATIQMEIAPAALTAPTPTATLEQPADDPAQHQGSNCLGYVDGLGRHFEKRSRRPRDDGDA
ncbi:hypothetical protein SDRG_01983 [Saprolegnia diclina VS20]|uniref:Uncharacterized protein n=1 Tax=Saprolegnia diclina (strain VS20) TaxID=1156394 RepID=T0S6U8_SAPDV|nr:hypothetical protein SDRG_01983 [Saprolegnia diclina VS20]EQC40918.1 hypothetical protein SDRG_01983 [Saprolegnia diclina VS20]|eukprot:XP_008605762.1 hypothetical protein SDRG_01983 [Saprolegnia diclina VS20]